MAEVIREERGLAGDHVEIAYRILQVGFVVAPTIAGLDKFFHLLTDWDRYLAPPIAAVVQNGHVFMLAVGVVEIIAGLIVAVKPKFGGYLVCLWLIGIIANLVLLNLTVGGGYWDIALRDLGLCLGAFALGQLATAHERVLLRRPARVETTTTVPPTTTVPR